MFNLEHVMYDGMLYKPDAPILWEKNGDYELWLTAKQASAREWKNGQARIAESFKKSGENKERTSKED